MSAGHQTFRRLPGETTARCTTCGAEAATLRDKQTHAGLAVILQRRRQGEAA